MTSDNVQLQEGYPTSTQGWTQCVQKLNTELYKLIMNSAVP